MRPKVRTWLEREIWHASSSRSPFLFFLQERGGRTSSLNSSQGDSLQAYLEMSPGWLGTKQIIFDLYPKSLKVNAWVWHCLGHIAEEKKKKDHIKRGLRLDWRRGKVSALLESYRRASERHPNLMLILQSKGATTEKWPFTSSELQKIKGSSCQGNFVWK